MKKKSIITALFLATIWFGQAQQLSQKVGTNPTLIHPSAVLEVESTTKGLLPPRMTEVQMNAIATSAEGLIVYCTDCTPKGLYNFDGTDWSAIGGAAATPSVVSDCAVNGFVGAYINGSATSGTTFSVTITNNSFSLATLAFQNTDLVLSGVTGLFVGAPTPTSATIGPGQSQLVTYPITGTPGTPGATGTLTGTWSKLSLTCKKTKTVAGLAAALNDANYCTNATINGAYMNGFALSASNTFRVTITNNSGSAINGFPAPNVNNLTWTGTGTINVASVSPTTTFNLANGASQIITYTLSGTPASEGTLTLDWAYSDLTCQKTKTVAGLAAALNDANYCTNATITGTYVKGAGFTASNTFRVTITNNSGSTINGFPAPNVNNLTPTWTGTGTINVASVSPVATFSLANGASQIITYTLSGTPTSVGTLTLDWAYSGLTCQKVKNIALGDATLSLPAVASVVSICQGAGCLQINIQGVVDNTANKKIVNVAYTGGLGSYSAYTSDWIASNNGTGEGVDDTNSFRISYPAGPFSASGSLPVTIEVDGDGSFNAKKIPPGTTLTIATIPLKINGNYKGDITLKIVTCGAPTSTGGFLVFQCHNLGADVSANPFTPSWQLNGAYFQWGKKPGDTNGDGYKTKPNSGTEGFAAAPTAGAANDGVVTNWSITDAANGAWNVTEGSPAKTNNDPCPSGYRVPTRNEWASIYSTTPANTQTNWSNVGTFNNDPTNYGSGKKVTNSLYLPASGYRLLSFGALSNRGNNGYYWSSTEDGTNAYALYFGSGSVAPANGNYRLTGFSVRCVAAD